MKANWGLLVGKPGLVRDGLQAVLSAIPGVNTLEPVTDEASALDRLDRHHLDLVILDSSLAEDELCTTLRRVNQRWPHVRCIVIADTPRQARALEAIGADAVLIEGFSPALLSTTIKDLLARSTNRTGVESERAGLDQTSAGIDTADEDR